ncbi:PduM family microcompartment protein [Listeria monocytogenes]|uniref:Microcompartment protein PduM n=1 Tax=Listeria monocytogenes TaxID=1639 RepID=A0AAN2Z2V9_LISMN|nr:PduM family microcompartment protein [Listeria monocytogenes]EHC6173035.1 PduM family microcompartment protein [Listeria monocytogenes serotype 1/2a]EAC2633596.1 microcompartment protein PduM [Listeria monocytogenes]EAC6061515.1 microcompartment protein PduM [Listeria monocytogenes]EAC8997661.1 microcompartment protein PduM [Listeria monocytogenes]EAD0630807.1 microcompartment protein PduM [Listeria monocytogenes]
MIEKLVKIIVQRLELRAANKTSIAVSKIPRDPVTIFMESGTVRLTQVNKHFLERILGGNRAESLNTWLETAADYGVSIELELYDNGEPWLDYVMLSQLNYPVFTSTGERLFHSGGQVICYGDSALIPSGSTLCKFKKQLITPLAKEYLTKNNIAVRERQ